MARFTIDKNSDYYLSVYNVFGHETTSWQVSKSPDFDRIIDGVEKSEEFKFEFITMLPKLPEDITDPKDLYYKDLSEFYVRCKIHVGESESPWVIISPNKPFDQREEDVMVTKGDETIKRTTAKELGWYA